MAFGRPVFDDSYFKTFVDKRDEYHFPELTQVTPEDGPRFYTDAEGFRYPSASAVAGFSKVDKLKDWRDRVGHVEAARITRIAGMRGHALHALAEHYVLGEREKFIALYKKTMPDALFNWTGIKRELDENLDEVRAIECRIFTKKYRIAGTADLVGKWKGRLAIIDYKTSLRIKKLEWIDNYFMQADTYGMSWAELTGETPDDNVILMAVDNEKDTQIFIEPCGAYLLKLKAKRIEFAENFGF
jgi:hypothetical protein